MVTKIYRNISLDYLDLMTEGDADMRNTMLDMLSDELPSEIQKMRPLFQEKNLNELREVSHKMKSTLAFIGNNEMTDANKMIEMIAKSGFGCEKIPDLIAILEQHLPGVLDDIHDSLQG